MLAGADFSKAAPAASFWQAKKESLILKHLTAVYNGKCDSLFKSSKLKMLRVSSREKPDPNIKLNKEVIQTGKECHTHW